MVRAEGTVRGHGQRARAEPSLAVILHNTVHTANTSKQLDRSVIAMLTNAHCLNLRLNQTKMLEMAVTIIFVLFNLKFRQ